MKYNVGIDIGGTFTDIIAVSSEGKTIVHKTLSTPHDSSVGFINGIREVAEMADVSFEKFVASIDAIVHGTTVATNALLERKGERMALFITKGFRDLLKIGNQSREDIFDLTCASPSLLYECVYEVDERIM